MALLGVLALAVPDAWRAFHVALVPHVACPFDGALVHEDELPAAGQAPTRREGSPSSFVPEHRHHGCDAPAWRHQISHPLSVSAPELQLAPAALAVDSGRPALGFSRAVLSYAPKLPPPRAGTPRC
ncbi:MAG TPA: hypothetical protein VHB79_23755 [Polyangiaceae bacterium]|nr:hypothetical protein [Polyangiaceae bacterium]